MMQVLNRSYPVFIMNVASKLRACLNLHPCPFLCFIQVVRTVKMDARMLSFFRPIAHRGRGGYSSSFLTEVVMVGGDQGVGDFRPERNRKWLFIFLISSLRLH